MLCTLVWANERTAPESIRALHLFPVGAITVGQSETSPTVKWLLEDFPSCSSSSLLGEGSSSLKDQSLLPKSDGESWMMTVLELWDLWGLKVLGKAWLSSLAVFPVQFGGSCWSDTGSSLWSTAMSDICGRSGKCGIGCNYAS